MDLLSLRKQIDEVDEKLMPLLIERMELSKAVAQYKKENSLPILNTQREQEILEQVRSTCPDEYKDAVCAVFSAIMDASKDVQKHIIDNKN